MAHRTAPAHHQDNLFGICHRIGEDFGIDPLWLRLGFGAAFIVAPMAVIAAYLALGGVVLVSRIVFPVGRPPSAEVVMLPEAAATVAPAAPLARAA